VPTLIEALQAKLPLRLYHQVVHTFWQMPAVAPKNAVINLAHDAIIFDTSGWRKHEDLAY
jgi:hypothetical protein